MITSQIIDQIVESSLVIADLSDNNPNVFYELAIRHIVQKPYIQMIQFGQEIPFDITGMRTIYFNVDLESAHKAKKELFDQIESIENNPFKPDNPITSAINQKKIFEMLTEKGNIESDNIPKVVLESVSELRSMIIDIKNEIYHLKTSPVSTKKQRFLANKEMNELEERISELKDEIYYKSILLHGKSYDKAGNEIIHQDNLSEILEEVDALEVQLEYLIRKRNEISHDSTYSSIQKLNFYKN